MYKKYFIKKRKGFSLMQTLLYTIMGLIIFTAFFSFLAGVKTANYNSSNYNDILYEVYNMESLVQDIKYAYEIDNSKLCLNEEPCSTSNSQSITYKQKFQSTPEQLFSGIRTNKYYYDATDKKIYLTTTDKDGVQTTVPQFSNVDSFSVKKVENKKNGKIFLEAIQINAIFSKGSEKYEYNVEISPYSWNE